MSPEAELSPVTEQMWLNSPEDTENWLMSGAGLS